MPPLACGVGVGAPWQTVRGGLPPLPSPPGPAGELVAAWQWERGVTESGGEVTSWASALDDGGGPYMLSALDANRPNVTSGGLLFAASDRLRGALGAIAGVSGLTVGVAFDVDPAYYVSAFAAIYLAFVFDSTLSPNFDFGRIVYPAGPGGHPTLQVRAGGHGIETYLLPATAMGAGAAVVAPSGGSSGSIMRGVVTAPTPGVTGWNSSPPLGGPFGAHPWSMQLGEAGGIGMVGTVRAAALWRNTAGDAVFEARAAWLQSL